MSNGRQRFGTQNGQCKLTEAIVREIRKRAKAGEMKKVLAEEFKVSRTSITHIIKFKTWSHVE